MYHSVFSASDLWIPEDVQKVAGVQQTDVCRQIETASHSGESKVFFQDPQLHWLQTGHLVRKYASNLKVMME